MLLLATLLASVTAVADPPPLLPETPDNWRFERMDIPLDFAPEFDYTGYEDLRFAPGMFDTESDSYFSYIMGLRLDERVEVDTKWVADFVTLYYRGLCGAVADSRSMDVDLDRITVDLEERAGTYYASVEWFDVFTTGQQITLAFELDVHLTDDTTELFGIVSPLPWEAPIWTSLRSMQAEWREARGMSSTPQPGPRWFHEHVARMTAGDGRWVADNSAYVSPEEPNQAYALHWKRGLSGTTMSVAMHPIVDGVEGDVVWRGRAVWHPGQEKVLLQDDFIDGMVGFGELSYFKGGTQNAMTYYTPDGESFQMVHESIETDDRIEMKSIFIGPDGERTVHRAYVWEREAP